MSRNQLVLGLTVLLLSVLGCQKDDIDPQVLKVNRFVKDNMELYYLWEDKLPAINSSKERDSKKYFDKLLYKRIDKWSFITDDVDALNNYFAGVRKEFGYSVRGYYFEEGSERIVAFVEYIEPDGPADRAGLKRGDLIVKINGSDITQDNYGQLFSAEAVSIGLGTVTDNSIIELSSSVNMVSEELQINPILKTEIFDVGGIKIAYLAYTSFIHEYNDQLEAVFAEFKSLGVSELILDLRYNSGGSISTARLMASLIGPTSNAGKLFLRTAYNEGLEEAIKNENPSSYTEWFEDYFETNPNNLGIENLYVLTTNGTASASEMVIYSLSPYINVVQIGEQTHGKYYGSITIDDKKEHNWAIQPIIMRAENVDNSIDYSQGLIPDVEMNDNYMYELGTKEDVLTAKAISQITGVTSKSLEGLKSASKSLGEPLLRTEGVKHPLKYEMYIHK